MRHDDDDALEPDDLRHLTERVARLDALLSAVPDFVYFKDRDRRFVEASGAFSHMFGRPVSEIVGRRDEELFPPEVAAHTVPDDERVIARGEAVIDRIEGGEIGGSETWVSTTKVPWRDRDGRIVGLLGISRDITASKKRIDALRQDAERGARLEALGRMAGGVAHDFNNVLMVILSAAEELGERLPAGHPGREDVELIHEASHRAAALTRQLLTFSRSKMGAARPTVLADLVGDLEPLLRRLVPDDVALTLDLAGRNRVLADPVELEQVVINLAVNARDAMPLGGDLRITVDDHAPDGRPGVRLVVSDVGTGLDDDAIARMFDPFWSTKPMGVGTGLGLATVQRIVAAAGGSIDVRSVRDIGTAMRVWLPATDARPRLRPVDATAPTEASLGSVMLVDDDPAVRAAVARMLRRTTSEVLVADGIDQALVMAEGRRLDALVTDVILREGTGVALAERLRSGQPDLPVLFMSGFPSDVFADRGIDPDAFELLPKPFTEVELIGRLRRLAPSPGPADPAPAGSESARRAP